MKKLVFIFIALAGFAFMFSCEDDRELATFDPAVATGPQLTVPAIALVEDNETDPIKFEWTAANYGMDVSVSYALEVDLSGADFANSVELYSGTELEYETTIFDLNNIVMGLVGEGGEGTEVTLEFRVSSAISTAVENLSSIASTAVTPYVTQDLGITLYLLGSATVPQWDNSAALPFTYLGDDVYEIYAFLDPGDGTGDPTGWKMIQTLGEWAPQWGAVAGGTFASGTLAYRPDETVADPIPCPGPVFGTNAAQDYHIVVDLANLTYTVEDGTGLYMLGDGTLAGWDNSVALPMTRVTGEANVFTITSTLGGPGLNIKFIQTLGEWAPQWGIDVGDNVSGTLFYRPDETVADPDPIPTPDEAGEYTIVADIENLTYTITPAAK